MTHSNYPLTSLPIDTQAELIRMRDRIERLRGLAKSLCGMLRDAGGDEWIREAEICQNLIGDMEAPL